MRRSQLEGQRPEYDPGVLNVRCRRGSPRAGLGHDSGHLHLRRTGRSICVTVRHDRGAVAAGCIRRVIRHRRAVNA